MLDAVLALWQYEFAQMQSISARAVGQSGGLPAGPETSAGLNQPYLAPKGAA